MMMDLTTDLSVLTNIPDKALDKLSELAEISIATDVWEQAKANEKITSVDIGIGVLHILNNETEVKYKFEPSSKLDERIKTALNTGVAPLTPRLIGSLKTKFMDVYKEIC